MSLEVSAYTNIRFVTEDDDIIARLLDTEAKCVQLYVDPHFVGRADSITHRALYRFDDSFEFSCGGNRWYGLWRNALACLTGLDSQVVLSTDPGRYADHSFFELLYFADNVGTLDQKTCEALRLDFEQYESAMSRGAAALATKTIETMRGEFSFGYPARKMDGVTPVGVARDFVAIYADFKKAVTLAAQQNGVLSFFMRISPVAAEMHGIP